jgi:hypothetical protein
MLALNSITRLSLRLPSLVRTRVETTCALRQHLPRSLDDSYLFEYSRRHELTQLVTDFGHLRLHIRDPQTVVEVRELYRFAQVVLED